MPTDATGSPTPLGIPKYNVNVDAPSGIGNNNTMDALDTIIGGRIPAPAGIASGEGAVWNGSAWVRSSVTPFSSSSLTNAPSGMPVGSVVQYTWTSAPAGWLLCDGSAVSRVGTNAALFALIGTTFGVGDGSTTFNLPDYRGRVPTGKGSHATVNAIGNNDGVAEASRQPKHTHTFTGSAGNTGIESIDHSHNEIVDSSSGGSVYIRPAKVIGFVNTAQASSQNTGGASNTHTHAFTPAGTISGGATVDTPSYLVVNFIVKL